MLALVGKASIKRRSGGAGWTSIGLLKGDTPLELNGEDVVEVDVGEGLLKLFLLFIWFVIVDEIVCLAACLARSVDTKLFTKSFRFPFTSGGGIRSIFTCCPSLLGILLLMKDGEFKVAVGLDNGETLCLTTGFKPGTPGDVGNVGD